MDASATSVGHALRTVRPAGSARHLPARRKSRSARLAADRSDSISLARRVAWRFAGEYLPLLASALVLAIATRPGSNSLLGLIALVPLFYTIHTARPLVAMIRGGVWGAAVAICLGIGLGETVHHWAALAILPLLTGAYAAGGAALTRWIGFSPLVLAVGWIGAELALSGLGLSLGLAAATQADSWLMQGMGRMLGYALVAFAVIFVNAAAARALRSLVAIISRPIAYIPKSAESGVIIGTQFAKVQPHSNRAAGPRGPPSEVACFCSY